MEIHPDYWVNEYCWVIFNKPRDDDTFRIIRTINKTKEWEILNPNYIIEGDIND